MERKTHGRNDVCSFDLMGYSGFEWVGIGNLRFWASEHPYREVRKWCFGHEMPAGESQGEKKRARGKRMGLNCD